MIAWDDLVMTSRLITLVERNRNHWFLGGTKTLKIWVNRLFRLSEAIRYGTEPLFDQKASDSIAL